MDSVGEGEGGEIWENGIEACIISYMKGVASPGSMHDTGCLGLVYVNKGEIDVFLELFCIFHDPVDVGNLISHSSAFSKTSLNIWKFTVHVVLKPGLESFEHYFASMWNECNCVIVWTIFVTFLLWDWNENWSFPVLWPLLSFPNLLAYWVQHIHSIIF